MCDVDVMLCTAHAWTTTASIVDLQQYSLNTYESVSSISLCVTRSAHGCNRCTLWRGERLSSPTSTYCVLRCHNIAVALAVVYGNARVLGLYDVVRLWWGGLRL